MSCSVPRNLYSQKLDSRNCIVIKQSKTALQIIDEAAHTFKEGAHRGRQIQSRTILRLCRSLFAEGQWLASIESTALNRRQEFQLGKLWRRLLSKKVRFWGRCSPHLPPNKSFKADSKVSALVARGTAGGSFLSAVSSRKLKLGLPFPFGRLVFKCLRIFEHLI